jgi:formamidopyrimidine-DNA glycosylase
LALGENAELRVRAFSSAWRYGKDSIKGLLMNQGWLAGVGNIYASEVCALVGIHPERTVMEAHQANKIAPIITRLPVLLRSAIIMGGTTFEGANKFEANGRTGQFVRKLRVYGRTGEPCRSCGKKIRELTQNGRTTYFCETCQR